MLFLPESPRYLMHKGRTLDAFKVWKRIRGVESRESRDEYVAMALTVRRENAGVQEGVRSKRFPWMDFFTQVPTSPVMAALLCFPPAAG